MLESLIARLTRASLRFKWMVIALAIGVLPAGVIALRQLDLELIPPLEFPQTVILAFNQGSPVTEMLDRVTRPIEAATRSLEGVVNVESTTSAGFSVVVVRNEFGIDQAALRDKLQAALDRVSLPGEMEPPELIEFGLSDLPIAFVSVSSSQLSLVELKQVVASEIVPELEALEGLANVQVTGGQELPKPPVIATVEPTPTREPTPTSEPTSVARGLPLPQTWIDLAASQGVTLRTTGDLTPAMVGVAVAVAPELLADFTPELILATAPEILAVIPGDLVAQLSPEQQQALAEQLGGLPPIQSAEDAGELPLIWQQAGQAQGIELIVPGDVTPQIMQGIAQFAPQLLDLLTADHLRLFTPEVLAWLPASYIETLDPALRIELEGLAEPAGGLGALAPAVSVGEQFADAPSLAGEWLQPPANDPTAPPFFQTAANLLQNGFAPTAAEFLNLLVANNSPSAPELMQDLSPEVILWLAEHEEGFLETLTPSVLRLFSKDTLTALPAEFLESLDPALAGELRAIAAGELETFIPTATINRVNGNPSLGLQLFKTSQANTVGASHEVFDKLEDLEAAHTGLKFNVVFEQASFIEESISGVAREGGLGAVFAVIVILMFLSGTVDGRYRLSWRSTLVTAVSIPLSIFMAFAAFRWLPPVADLVLGPLDTATRGIPVLGSVLTALHRLFPLGITLNIMTLSGLTVAVGRVVDDSIVVLENIYRHIQRGDALDQAVLSGTRDVAIAILASTVTTVVVFLPIGLLGGLVGQFFLPFGVAVTYALASSFLVAVTVVPLLAYLFIRKEHLPAEAETSLQRAYTPLLRWALAHRGQALAIAGLLFVGSLFLLSQRPQAFLPELGEVQISTSVSLPDGTTMAETDRMVAEFETELAEIEGIGTISSEIGTAGGLQSLLLGAAIDQGAATVSASVEQGGILDRLTAEVRERGASIFGEEYVIVSGGTLSGSAFGGFALVVSGDSAMLEDFNDRALATLGKVEGLANVSSNLGDVESILRVDGESAVRYTGELETADTLGVSGAAKAELDAIAPEGITVSEGFETRQQTEGFQQAVRAVLVSVLAVYLVMVITFRSFVHPFVILFSLPLALIGAAAALWLTNRVIGIPVLIGLMMLVGIVVTNAIVLMYRVQANRKLRGMSASEALIEGGRTRLRPILMTAIAAILALVPLALGLTEGAIIASELATVVIGGLLTSTLLTLLVVPVMYSVLDRLARPPTQVGGAGTRAG
ncbi:MAG: efflux RND transporter permease subunit [Anaerolineales bacterium]